MLGERENGQGRCPIFKKLRIEGNGTRINGSCWGNLVFCGGNPTKCSESAIRATLFVSEPVSPTTVTTEYVSRLQAAGLIGGKP